MDIATPLPLLSVDEARAAGSAIGLAPRVAEANVMRFALRHRGLAEALGAMIDAVVLEGHLDARLREIAILRVAWRIGSVYEWSNHVGLATQAGLTDAEVVAIRTADAAVLSEQDRLAVAVVDDVLDTAHVSDAVLDRARALLGDGDELLELVAIPGFYRAIGALLLTFAVPLEDHLRPWAPDGNGPHRDPE